MGLSETERQAFAQLAASLPDDSIGHMGGMVLADLLRTTAPDVDDVTLGRIAAAFMRHLRAGERAAEQVIEATGEPPEKVRGAVIDAGLRQLACAALHLTELEWKEPPR